MTLDELEASLASPIVATPPALLRPGVGAAHRGGAAARGRGLLANRPSVSGSFVSSRCGVVFLMAYDARHAHKSTVCKVQ